VYAFNTINGRVISVYFSPDQYVEYVADYPTLLSHGYGFGFYPTAEPMYNLNAPDEKIKKTIARIIFDFLNTQGEDVVLLYHCDHADEKQALRNRKFNYWYDSCPDSVKIVKETIELEKFLPNGTSKNYYMGYITPIGNKVKDLVKAEFEDFAVNLTNEDKKESE
jgi:hypothetical protein